MRDLRELDEFRIVIPRFGPGGNMAGAFEIPSPATGAKLRVIVSVGSGVGHEMEMWDHASVSLPNRCPNWQEMELIKRKFFHDHECAMQLHVPVEDHIDNHPYCLHIWRPVKAEIPRPPGLMVGVKGVTLDTRGRQRA